MKSALLMIASGLAGLGYQIVSTQQSALWLGHEAAAVRAVITAVFGGMGFGALILGRAIERSARPAWWYAACEAARPSSAFVSYRAPRITYASDSLPRDRLIALLHEVEITPDELMVSWPEDEQWRSRLSPYWAARNRFIEVGRDIRPTPDARRMLAQLREPLLSVLRISPDFRPAYDPLMQMARGLVRMDPAAARSVLGELQRTQPARPEAAEALRGLAGVMP